MPSGAPASAPSPLPAAAAADAAADLARSDTSLGRIATTSGALLTIMAAGVGLTSGDGDFPMVSKVAMGAAAVILAAIMAALSAASWPRRRGSGGVPYYRTLTPDALAAELEAAAPARWHAERAVVKAGIAHRRYRYQRVAEVGQAVAGALLAVAIIAALI